MLWRCPAARHLTSFQQSCRFIKPRSSRSGRALCLCHANLILACRPWTACVNPTTCCAQLQPSFISHYSPSASRIPMYSHPASSPASSTFPLPQYCSSWNGRRGLETTIDSWLFRLMHGITLGTARSQSPRAIHRLPGCQSFQLPPIRRRQVDIVGFFDSPCIFNIHRKPAFGRMLHLIRVYSYNLLIQYSVGCM